MEARVSRSSRPATRPSSSSIRRRGSHPQATERGADSCSRRSAAAAGVRREPADHRVPLPLARDRAARARGRRDPRRPRAHLQCGRALGALRGALGARRPLAATRAVWSGLSPCLLRVTSRRCSSLKRSRLFGANLREAAKRVSPHSVLLPHHVQMRMFIALAALLTGCIAPPSGQNNASPPYETSLPSRVPTVSSAMSTSAPPAARPRVVLVISSHESHDPAGHRVYLWPEAGAEDVDEVRITGVGLVAPVTGAVLPVTQNWGCVSRVPRAAVLQMPSSAIRDWASIAPPAKYAVEARIGPIWYTASLISSGCFSIE